MSLSVEDEIIEQFATKASEDSMLELIQYAKINDITNQGIVKLATVLVDSGGKLKPSNTHGCYDIPSTGGPSSLSTIICPIILRGLGKQVIKLGVPGRPAGGIDSLAQISGYKTNLSEEEIRKVIDQGGYVHFITNHNYAPLDGNLFSYRKQNNGLNIPALVIASILSKKIAVGLSHIGLDVRVSSFGNFGSTWEQARANSKRFNEVASLCGITTKCFITDGFTPQQPYIGRGEALVAVDKIFNSADNYSLKKHFDQCLAMCLSLADMKGEPTRVILKKAYNAFSQNITLQQGSLDSYYFIVDEVQRQHKYSVQSSSNGFLHINMQVIRDTICNIQNKHNKAFPDPCGIILQRNAGDYVSLNDQICTFRCVDEHVNDFRESITKAFIVRDNPIDKHFYEEVL